MKAISLRERNSVAVAERAAAASEAAATLGSLDRNARTLVRRVVRDCGPYRGGPVAIVGLGPYHLLCEILG